MSDTDLDRPPFIKWGDYKSQNQDKPDILELEVVAEETFETPYSTNVRVQQKEDGNWNEKILPLKSHDSANSILIQQWNRNKTKIRVGRKFLLKTYLARSKKTNRPLRRFVLEFL